MTKTLIIAYLFLIVTSCNTNEKKTKDTAHNQETTQIEVSIKRGKAVYNNMCITCHMANGKGVPRAFPPLADSDY